MQTIKVWHNPRCAKSRDAIKILEENNVQSDVIKYLDSIPSVEEITKTLQMLNLAPRDMMRTTESIYKELNLKEEMDDSKLIEAMATNPKLIQRPILFKGDKAIIGRPASVIALSPLNKIGDKAIIGRPASVIEEFLNS